MPAIDSALFDDIDNAISDLRGSALQTFPRALKRLSDALHPPALANINASLTAGLDFEAFYNKSLSSGGSMVGSHQLAWPPEREKELGLTLVLIDRLAFDPNWAVQFCHTFFYSGSKIIAGVHTLANQLLIPFARDYRKYVERQLRDQDASGRALGMARGPISIFISHIHEEAAIAKTLKQWLEASFPGHISAFVSSDYEDIPLGKKWLAEIEAAMDRSLLLITLVSPASFERMWIHLEAGWALGRKIDVLPICHSGRTAGELPRPYGDFNGVDIDSSQFGVQLLSAFKTRLEFDHALPKAMTDALNRDVRGAVSSIIQPKHTPPSAPTGPGKFQPDEVEMNILRVLLEAHDRGAELPGVTIASHLKLRPAKAEYHLNRLTEAGLLSMSLVMNEGALYYLSDEGISFLVECGELK